MRYVHSALAAALCVLLAVQTHARAADTTTITVPAGTVIPVRMIDSIDSSQNHPGQTFRGSLDAPIHVKGRTMLTKGARAFVKLVEVQSAGKLTGHNELRLQLDRIVTGNTTYTVRSGVVLKGSSQGKKTGKYAGIGALVGGGIGAIAGGGKGAAIGAGAGAGTGVAAKALRKTKPVRVASESVVRFRLNAPLHVKG